MGLLTGKKIVMILPPADFSDEEFFKSRVALQAQGAIVTTASKGVEETTGTGGGKARIDLALKEVHPKKYDALVFIGGKGANAYFRDKEVLALVKETVRLEKIVGSICIAPQIFANAGILKGKKATGCAAVQNKLQKAGAIVRKKGVVTDGIIITAADSSDAELFGEQLAKVIAAKGK